MRCVHILRVGNALIYLDLTLRFRDLIFLSKILSVNFSLVKQLPMSSLHG